MAKMVLTATDQRHSSVTYERNVTCMKRYPMESNWKLKGALRKPQMARFWLGKKAMRTILIIVLVLLLVGALPTWPYSSGWGYYPSSGLGLVLGILLILMLLGHI